MIRTAELLLAPRAKISKKFLSLSTVDAVVLREFISFVNGILCIILVVFSFFTWKTSVGISLSFFGYPHIHFTSLQISLWLRFSPFYIWEQCHDDVPPKYVRKTKNLFHLPRRQRRRRRYRSNVVNLPLAYSVYYVLGIRNREARNSIDRRSFPLTLLPLSHPRTIVCCIRCDIVRKHFVD